MIRMIAAASLNGVIGQNNGLPWAHDYPEDLKFFKEKTLNSTIIMGRKTFESIGKALPKRRNIVLTNKTLVYHDQFVGSFTDKPVDMKDIELCSSFDDALKTCKGDGWIIGGAHIYQKTLPYVEELYITSIPKIITGDGLVYMPYINPDMFLQADECVELSKEKQLYVNIFRKEIHRMV